jgi:hypothetical protein
MLLMRKLGGWSLAAIAAFGVGCGSVNDAPDVPDAGAPGVDSGLHDPDASVADPDASVTPPPDAAPPADAPPARLCAHGDPFVSFAPLVSVNTSDPEQNAFLTHDELTILFSRNLAGGGAGDLFVAQRAHREDGFGAATPIAELNTEVNEYRASLSDDGLTIYFDRRDHGSAYTILTAVRSSAGSAFGTPAPVANVNTVSSNYEPFVTADGMYFGSSRSGGIADLFFAPRAGATGFGTVQRLTELDDPATADEIPVPSLDGLAVYFGATRTADTAHDVWLATRSAPGAVFGAPGPVPMLATAEDNWPTWLSDDNCRLYYVERTAGDSDLWVASR